MSDTPEDRPPVLTITTNQDRDTTNDLVPVDFDGVMIYGERPKMAVLLKVVQVMMDATNPLLQGQALVEFVPSVLDEESAAHVQARLEDPDDPLDLDNPAILSLFQGLIGLWYGRPTGKPPVLRDRLPRSGKRSTATSPSPASTP